MQKGKKLVCGVGINDADYVVQKYQVTDKTSPTSGKRIQKRIWVCPYYEVWKSMLKRCYSNYVHNTSPTYKGCVVCDDWKYFSKFKKWMETQDWEGKELDKDILFPDNKIYSPSTCIFISKELNCFIHSNTKIRGLYKIGVHKVRTRYIAGEGGNYIGSYDTEDEAHEAWFKSKQERAQHLTKDCVDHRIVQAVQEWVLRLKEDK